MSRESTIALFVLISIALAGCAGSASHNILSKHEEKDSSLSCTEIAVEMSRAQT